MSGGGDPEVVKDRVAEEKGEKDPVKPKPYVKPDTHVVAINKSYEQRSNTIKLVTDYLNGDAQGKPNWKEKRFMYIHLLPLCRSENRVNLIPAEVAVVVFSFNDGIVDSLQTFIDPGEIPLIELGESKLNREVYGLPAPGTAGVSFIQTGTFMTVLLALANKHKLIRDKELMLTTAISDLPIVHNALVWIFRRTGHNMSCFPLIPFEFLLMNMSTRVQDPNQPGIIEHEGGAAKFIHNTRYDYCMELGCSWHQKSDVGVYKIDRCANNVAKRRVYNALLYLCHLFEVDIPPGSHAPVMLSAK